MTRRISTTTVMVLVGEVVNMGKRKLLLASGLASGFPFFCFVASRLPFFGVFFVSGCPFFHDCSQLDTLCRAVSCTQQTVNFLERKSRTMRKRWFQNWMYKFNQLKILIVPGADWFEKRSALVTLELISNFPNMDLTSNPTSSTFHTQPSTNQTLVQGTNYNQATNHSQGTNLRKPAYQLYPLHHPPVGSLLLLQGELWIETENIYRKKIGLLRSFKIFSNTEGKALILVQGSGKA